jgi:hypothetical protein
LSDLDYCQITLRNCELDAFLRDPAKLACGGDPLRRIWRCSVDDPRQGLRTSA